MATARTNANSNVTASAAQDNDHNSDDDNNGGGNQHRRGPSKETDSQNTKNLFKALNHGKVRTVQQILDSGNSCKSCFVFCICFSIIHRLRDLSSVLLS